MRLLMLQNRRDLMSCWNRREYYHQGAGHTIQRVTCFDSKIRNHMDKTILRCVLTIFLVAGIFALGDALAVDGNLSNPYGSQWDNPSRGASLSLDALFGVFLLLLNVLGAGIIFIRNRKRQRLVT